MNAAHDRLGAVFGALDDTTRRAILVRLSGGPATISELALPFQMTLTAVSKHVGVLERAGLVERTRRGRAYHCSLRAEPLREAASWTEQFRSFWETRLDGLAAYLSEET